VLGLDILKGVLAVFFAGVIIGENYFLVGNFALGLFFAQALAASAAIIGHIWPVFAHFKGGRGVATFCGGVIALYPAAAIFGGEVFAITAGLTGFASLGSITGMVGAYAILVPLAIKHGFPVEYLSFVLFGTILITFMHRDNIKRLLTGKERRINDQF
jgi:glycerol-3-phosphate acyltransferase PlsY